LSSTLEFQASIMALLAGTDRTAIGPQQLIIRKRLVTGVATNGRYPAERTRQLDWDRRVVQTEIYRTREGAGRYH
jgi:hypothetical protein